MVLLIKFIYYIYVHFKLNTLLTQESEGIIQVYVHNTYIVCNQTTIKSKYDDDDC